MTAKNEQMTYSEFCSADIIASNLFEPFRGTEEKSRGDVNILKVADYSKFTDALCLLINDWLSGEIGHGAPTEPSELAAIRKVNVLNGDVTKVVKDRDELDPETKAIYENLVAMKVLGHLRIVTSHRKWIRRTLQFCKLIGVKFSDQLDNLVWRHDLSKYSHKEVLGYAIMFGDGSVDFRQLQTEDEKFEWDNTLYNHYAHNPHHPEYFYPLQEDGRRVRDKSMVELDPVSGQDYLDESIVDMLAANGERQLADEPVIYAKNMMTLAGRFFRRYAAIDGEIARQKLAQWREKAKTFLDVPENVRKVHALFDNRAILYDEDKAEGFNTCRRD